MKLKLCHYDGGMLWRYGNWDDVNRITGCGPFDRVNCLAGEANKKVAGLKMRKLLLWIFIAGFITNLIWENAQAPLYEGYEGFSQHFLFCLAASIVDGAVIVGFYLLASLVRGNIFWILNITVKDIGILVMLGIATAIAFEMMALDKEAWNYNENMPLILGLGLIPLIQLPALSVISIYLVKTFVQSKQSLN
jgi:hypothetical protein